VVLGSPLGFAELERRRRESAAAYLNAYEIGGRAKFFKVLTVTKHFLFFFPSN
jgi:hypothetical protein